MSVSIPSTEHWVDTGITLEQGKTYRIVASGQWKDASIVTNPDGYPSANAFQRLTEGRRRLPDAAWFALVGALDRRDDTMFLIGSGTTYEMKERSAQLTCFANDIIGFYWNNEGSITVDVTEAKLP